MSLLAPFTLWLIIGFTCIIIEFTVTGIGLLFLGIGGLINAILIYNYPYFLHYQYISFGIISFISFIFLWKPLKNFVNLPAANDQFNIVGSSVKVINKDILPGSLGEVMWSGTIMNAILDNNELGTVSIGQKLYIKEVRGNILVCVRNLD